MSDNGQRYGASDDYTADGSSGIRPADAPVERVISDTDAAREVSADVPEDDPDLEYKLSVYRYEEQPEEAFPDVDYSRQGETAIASRPGRSVGDILTIVLLVAIPIAIAALLLAVSQSNRQAQQNAAIAETPTPIYYANQLPIVDHNAITQSDGTVAVDVTLLNKGSANVLTVNVLVRLLDGKGNQVGSGIIPIQNIAAGSTAKGQVSIKPTASFTSAEYLISSLETDQMPTLITAPSPTASGR